MMFFSYGEVRITYFKWYSISINRDERIQKEENSVWKNYLIILGN